jgi:hypothetical protein
MKGAELPINTLIIFIIVLVVLVAIIGFFFGVWNPGAGGVQLEAVKTSACNKLVTTGCEDPDDIKKLSMDLDGDGSPGGDGDTLTLLCSTHYDKNKADCRAMCGC